MFLRPSITIPECQGSLRLGKSLRIWQTAKLQYISMNTSSLSGMVSLDVELQMPLACWQLGWAKYSSQWTWKESGATLNHGCSESVLACFSSCINCRNRTIMKISGILSVPDGIAGSRGNPREGKERRWVGYLLLQRVSDICLCFALRYGPPP